MDLVRQGELAKRALAVAETALAARGAGRRRVAPAGVGAGALEDAGHGRRQKEAPREGGHGAGIEALKQEAGVHQARQAGVGIAAPEREVEAAPHQAVACDPLAEVSEIGVHAVLGARRPEGSDIGAFEAVGQERELKRRVQAVQPGNQAGGEVEGGCRGAVHGEHPKGFGSRLAALAEADGDGAQAVDEGHATTPCQARDSGKSLFGPTA